MRNKASLNARVCRRTFLGAAIGLGATLTRSIDAMAFSGPVSSISIGGVTFTFAEPVLAGEYLDAGIVPVVGPVTVSSYSPAKDDFPAIINGATLNHVFEGPRNWDGRSVFSSADTTQPALPVTLTSGDIFIASRSNFSIDPTDRKMVRKGVVEEYAALVVVDTPPKSNTLSPPLISWKGRTSVEGVDCDIDAFLKALPRYVVSSNVPSATEVLFFMDKLNLGLSISKSDSYSEIPKVNTSAYEMWTPASSAIENGSNYGAGQAAVIDAAGLLLTLDSTYISDKDRRAIAVRLAQCGCQWYETLTGIGELYNEGGAHFQFHLVPMLVYLAATGQFAKLNTLIEDTGGSFTQCFRIDRQMVENAVTPHDSDTESFWFTRRRGILGVSGEKLRIFVTSGGRLGSKDPGKLKLEGMSVIRESDSARATIAETLDGIWRRGTDHIDVAIDVQPSPPFKTGDVIYFGPQYPIVEGNFDWAIRSNLDWRWLVPSKLASYRSLNNYSGSALFAQTIIDSFPSVQAEGLVNLIGYTHFSNEDAVLPAVHSQFKAAKRHGGKKYRFVETYWNELASKFAEIPRQAALDVSRLTVTDVTPTSAVLSGDLSQDEGIVYVAVTNEPVNGAAATVDLVERKGGVFSDAYIVQGGDKAFRLDLSELAPNQTDYYANVVQRDAIGNLGSSVTVKFETPAETAAGEFAVTWRGFALDKENGPYSFEKFPLGGNPSDRKLFGAVAVRGALTDEDVRFGDIAARKLDGAFRENAHQRLAFWMAEPSGSKADVQLNVGGTRGAFAGWSAVNAAATGYSDSGPNPRVILDVPPGATVVAAALHTQGELPAIKGLSNVRANTVIENGVAVIAADEEFQRGAKRHVVSLDAVKNAMLVVAVFVEDKS